MKTSSELKVFKSKNYDYIYIYYKQGCLIRINTRYTVVKNGMTKELLFKNTVPDYKTKNNQIILMKQRVDKYISEKLISKSPHEINQKEAYNAAFNIASPDTQGIKLLIPIFNKYVSDLNSERNYKGGTIKYYNNLKGCFEQFEKDVLRHKLSLGDFNTKESLIKFSKFLADKRGMNDNSIAKRVNSLKSFLRYCSENGICTIDPTLFSYKVKKYDPNVFVLKMDEIQQLLDLKIENPSWQKIRDVFVCNCFMGLRISDLSKSSKANFIKDEDGDYMYESTNKKTSNKVTIPIIEIPLTILKKYDFNLPKYTGQYFNRELKKILKHYKLFEDEIIKRREVHNVEFEKKKLKREIISSHICRKTFITLCVESLLPVNVIMKASGHKQLATIQSYIQRSADKDQFQKLNKKVKDNLKVFRKNTTKAHFEEENLKSPPYQRL